MIQVNFTWQKAGIWFQNDPGHIAKFEVRFITTKTNHYSQQSPGTFLIFALKMKSFESTAISIDLLKLCFLQVNSTFLNSYFVWVSVNVWSHSWVHVLVIMTIWALNRKNNNCSLTLCHYTQSILWRKHIRYKCTTFQKLSKNAA